MSIDISPFLSKSLRSCGRPDGCGDGAVRFIPPGQRLASSSMISSQVMFFSAMSTII